MSAPQKFPRGKAVSPTETRPVDRQHAERLVREQFRIIETGDLARAAGNVTADFLNHRSAHEPLAARGRGPAALAATTTWLRRAFSEIRFEVHDITVVDDLAIAWVTLHAVASGPFVVHDAPDGRVTQVFPPTGRPFATRQVHWFRIAEGAIAEHDAVRDDLGMAGQAGWLPPRPGYLLRMLAARHRERRRSPARTATPNTAAGGHESAARSARGSDQVSHR
ncbi:MAG: ester cyclase [Pseudonocardia sp.]|nr:ester cyclase [Pseudonocardia sp.]